MAGSVPIQPPCTHGRFRARSSAMLLGSSMAGNDQYGFAQIASWKPCRVSKGGMSQCRVGSLYQTAIGHLPRGQATTDPVTRSTTGRDPGSPTTNEHGAGQRHKGFPAAARSTLWRSRRRSHRSATIRARQRAVAIAGEVSTETAAKRRRPARHRTPAWAWPVRQRYAPERCHPMPEWDPRSAPATRRRIETG